MLFDESRLKIKRANEYISDVKKRIDIVISPDSQTSWIEVDSKTGAKIIHYRLNKLGDLPDIALVIGDAIHNLKTALDYAWLQTIRKVVPSAESNFAKLPVYPTVDSLKSALGSNKIDTISPALFNLVVSRIEPYNGGNVSIWGLHKMDIADKHRLLIPTKSHGNASGIKLKDQQRFTFFSAELPEEFTVEIDPHHEIEDKGSVSFGILFKEGPMKSLEAFGVLHMFRVTVCQVVELMEKFIES